MRGTSKESIADERHRCRSVGMHELVVFPYREVGPVRDGDEHEVIEHIPMYEHPSASKMQCPQNGEEPDHPYGKLIVNGYDERHQESEKENASIDQEFQSAFFEGIDDSGGHIYCRKEKEYDASGCKNPHGVDAIFPARTLSMIASSPCASFKRRS